LPLLLSACCQPEQSTTTTDYAGLEAEVVAWHRDNFETPIAKKQPFEITEDLGVRGNAKASARALPSLEAGQFGLYP